MTDQTNAIPRLRGAWARVITVTVEYFCMVAELLVLNSLMSQLLITMAGEYICLVAVLLVLYSLMSQNRLTPSWLPFNTGNDHTYTAQGTYIYSSRAFQNRTVSY